MMSIDIIEAAWKNGYRTRQICTTLATLLFKSHFYDHNFYGVLEEHAMEIVYGSPDQKYGEYTAMECMERGAFYTYYNLYGNTETLKRMEAVWDNLHVIRYKKRFQKHYKASAKKTFRNRSKTYTFQYRSIDGCWSSREEPSRAIIRVEGSHLSMIKVKGVDPTLEQTTVMCFAAVSRSVSSHKYNRDERIYPFRINQRVGYSGCEDYFLDLYGRNNDLFYKVKNAAKLHISMAGKVYGIDEMYVGDIIELLLAANGFKDFDYTRSTKIFKTVGVRFARPYNNEILTKEDMDFIPVSMR